MKLLLLLVSSEGFLKPGGNAGPIMGLDSRGGEKKKKKSFFQLRGKNITDQYKNKNQTLMRNMTFFPPHAKCAPVHTYCRNN